MIFMFDNLIGLVTSPQFGIDVVDFAIAFDYDSLALAFEDLLLFNADMMAEMSSI